MQLPSRELIVECTKPGMWDLSNDILYKMCSDNFDHNTVEKVINKTLLVGRVYAAALERRKNKASEINDDFYIQIIGPHFVSSKLDSLLIEIKNEVTLTQVVFQKTLQIHKYLTDLVYEITRLEKRSFASKYLHFHLPRLFFIYDSRVCSIINQFVDGYYAQNTTSIVVDKEYSKFASKCFYLQKAIREEYGISLSPRQIDNLLIKAGNEKLVLKNTQRTFSS